MARLIYGLIDPREPSHVRYVGYTANGLSRRRWEHLHDARLKPATNHRRKWISMLLRDGVEPSAIVIEELAGETSWQERERFWIAHFGERLTNNAAGGEGLIDPHQSVRQRISEKVSRGLVGNQRRKGIPHSNADREKISRSMLSSEKARKYWDRKKGTKLSEETKRLIGAAHFGRPHSVDHRAKISAALRLRVEECRERMTGSRWVTDAVRDRILPREAALPEGWMFGRSAAQRTVKEFAFGYSSQPQE